jgi:hypothetical protein
MHVAYLAVTIIAALAVAYAAALDFVGAESVKLVADRVGVSHRWMLPLGTVLAAGAIGLLLGLALPPLGVAAAIGLVLYFLCAVGAHIRARDPGVGGAVFFLVLVVGALVVNLAHDSG